MSARRKRRTSTREPSTKRKTQRRKAARRHPTLARAEAGDPIRHVVWLMLENRSFDQMLGMLQAEIPDVDGVPPNAPPRFNEYPPGTRYLQEAGAPTKVKPDPPHEHEQVIRQLENGNAHFVETHATRHRKATPAQLQQVMSCHAPGELFALHALARAFVICDGWYCSVPGPTWTNRLFAMSGTSLGRLEMPSLSSFDLNLHHYEQASVFRRLLEARRSHRIYFGDFPLALLLQDQRTRRAARHFSRLSRFFDDTRGDESEFAEFAFLEPDYLWPGANDDHPPHDVRRGQALVADVYEAIRANDALWRSTLLVISYDEHGGFYDHLAPPAAVPPDDSEGEHGFGFDRLGVRVPTLLVSPWLDPGVLHGTFDHTSLLRMLQKRLGLGDLRARVAAAQSPLDALSLRTTPRSDAPVRLPRPAAAAVRALRAMATEAKEPLNDHQRAILAFSEYLEVETKTTPARTRMRAARRKLEGPAPSSDVARERALRFLRERGAPV